MRITSATQAHHWISSFLSPFGPLMILSKHAELVFDYEHRFEPYLLEEERVFGHSALPVLLDIVAAAENSSRNRLAAGEA